MLHCKTIHTSSIEEFYQTLRLYFYSSVKEEEDTSFSEKMLPESFSHTWARMSGMESLIVASDIACRDYAQSDERESSYLSRQILLRPCDPEFQGLWHQLAISMHDCCFCLMQGRSFSRFFPQDIPNHQPEQIILPM